MESTSQAPPATAEAQSESQLGFAYGIAFVCGAGLFAVSLVAGLGRDVVANRRLPSAEIQPLAGAAEALARGNRRWAAREYRMAGILMPRDYSTLLSVATGLRQAGDMEGALAATDRAESIRPASPEHDVVRGEILRLQRKNDLAWAAFSRALQKDSGLASAWAGLGNLMLDQDRYAEAIRLLSRSLELREPDADVHNSLAIAYLLSGDSARGVEHFTRAVALAPTPEHAANLSRARAALLAGQGSRP